MYEFFREQLSENRRLIWSPLSEHYSLFIDISVQRQGLPPPPNQNSKKTKNQTQLYPDTKKEQREELCNKYFLLHCQKDEVFIISATGELFDKEDLWTDKRKQLISPIVLGNLIHDIER